MKGDLIAWKLKSETTDVRICINRFASDVVQLSLELKSLMG